MTEYREEEVLQRKYWEEGKSLKQIAEEYDVQIHTIQRWMKKNDIPRRDHKQRQKFTRVNYARFEVRQTGHEAWQAWDPKRQSTDTVLIHRLLAVSEHGFDAVRDKHVHHRNGIPWDNRPGNIEVLTEEEHKSLHSKDGRLLRPDMGRRSNRVPDRWR
ncbi:HNH protein [Halovirus HCTV-5]|uniref:HNH endonuclease n=1 Tax=Halovirus HCTV-5 TaxID=1273748 RepID=UPI0003348524|nr:HNH endonuclease [Halovirus HCTV-5]AGM11632.1 HNH protein [Halovirus HCTV-5]